MIPQVADLLEEGKELREFLATLDESDFDRVTQFKDWTVNDVVLHLHASDVQAIASATDAGAYLALRRDIVAKRATGLSPIEEARSRYPGIKGRRLLARWSEHLEQLCVLLAAKDPASRLQWGGPDMGVRMFTTARQMETWAHGQAIYDLMAKERVVRPRIKNVAVIGVGTFGWTFTNRKLAVPSVAPYVRLISPAGEVWEWNTPARDNAVGGDAVEFCQVVTQVRNVADTRLAVTGDTARRWMDIAQCFAGPPSDPPAPGTRYKASDE